MSHDTIFHLRVDDGIDEKPVETSDDDKKEEETKEEVKEAQEAGEEEQEEEKEESNEEGTKEDEHPPKLSENFVFISISVPLP